MLIDENIKFLTPMKKFFCKIEENIFGNTIIQSESTFSDL